MHLFRWVPQQVFATALLPVIAHIFLMGTHPLTAGSTVAGSYDYHWMSAGAATRSLLEAVPAPPGFERVPAPPGSFAAWLRGLPIRPAGTPVRIYDGRPLWDQNNHVAVIDIDVGKTDLQQCADAIIRLRAEYLFARGRASEIAFNYTSGERITFARWQDGWRPRVGPKGIVGWRRDGARGAHYHNLREYLRSVFTYAGTYSLSQELKPVTVSDMRIGDLFIQGGFPGHAILVADMVRNPKTGERRFLLLQSFMPAQDMHILKNPRAPDGSPWYPLSFGAELITPVWTFTSKDLRRFPE